MLVLQRNGLILENVSEMATLEALVLQGNLGDVAWMRMLLLVYAQLWGSF